MDTRRQSKVASLLQEALSEIFTRDGKGYYGKAFVTITNVKVTPDLAVARFYLSIFNVEDKEATLQKIVEHKHEIKRSLNEKLRYHLRVMPQLDFFVDDTLDHVYHMEELFKKIKDEKPNS